jgi:aspartate racemase
VRRESPLPWLGIAEVVAAEARRRRFRTIGVLGTRFLMEGPVYRDTLAAAGLKSMTPPAAQRREINRIIFTELVNGRFTDTARQWFCETVIAGLTRRGCDAVVLGCTEIPLLVDDACSPLPTLDSTRLLARAAIDRAVDG